MRALEIDPNAPSVHHVFGLYLYSIGEFDDAIAEMKDALDLDPLDPLARWNLGRILLTADRREEAVREFRQALAIEPDFAWPHIGLGLALIDQGRHDEAMTELAAARLAGGSRNGLLGYAYALAGNRAEAERNAKALADDRKGPALGYQVAALELALGKPGEALESLERAFMARDDELVYLKVDDRFGSLRRDPAFQDLVRRVGIPP